MRDQIARWASAVTCGPWIAGACAAVALLVGCAPTGGGSALSIFAEPGKYQFSSCESLAAWRRDWERKEEELRLLMDRAEKGTGGALVNVLAYQGDYITAKEELRNIDSAERAKNCNSWGSNSAVH
jgi:hypothetical protein